MTRQLKKVFEYLALLLIWAGVLALFGALSRNFLSARTFAALANRIPALAVVSTGMTLVLIVGGIDLSVGSVLGLAGAVLGFAMVDLHWPLWVAALSSLAAGIAAGAINGCLSVLLRIPSFIVTLGMLEAARGLAYLVTRSQTKYIGGPVESISAPLPQMFVSPAFVVALIVVAAGQVLLSLTVPGRHMIATGSNDAAATLSGVNTKRSRILVFILMGGLSGLGALFYTSRLGSSDPNAGVGMELSAIAAVVIGGTSLLGGRGSVINSFFGVLIIATLEAGLAQAGVSEPSKRVVTGAVIIVAVVIDAWRRRKSVA